MSKFNTLAFVASFDKDVTRLKRAEAMTKELVKAMSRGLLWTLHIEQDNPKHGDIGFINRFLGALSPANRRVAVLFFKEWTGFIYQDDAKAFTKKSKKHYDDVQKRTLDKLSTDPIFNMWSWQDARLNMEVVPTPYTIEKVKETVLQMVKKADKANIGKKEILVAMLETGFTLQDIIDCLDTTHHVGDVVQMIDEQYQEVQA